MFAELFATYLAKCIAFLGISITLTVVPLSAVDTIVQNPLYESGSQQVETIVDASDEADSSQQDAEITTALEKLPAGSAWLETLPLGDGKYVTSGPKKGFIYVCHVGGDGGGAQSAGTWINAGNHTWNPSEKIAVQGNASWPSAAVSIKISGTSRIITTNDLPVTHKSGVFPVSATDPAYKFDRNPNSIQTQSFTFTLPLNPTVASKPDCIYGEVGVMTTGVLLFDGFDAENRDAAAWEVQDQCDAHPQINGAYHYHSLSSCIKNIDVTEVIGYAFDGFPITGPKLPSGNYLHTADLDECHGMTSSVSLDGKNVSTYHYVMTQDFPYSVSCFKGKSTQKGPIGGAPTSAAGIVPRPVTQGGSAPASDVSGTSAGMPPAGGSQGGIPPQEAIAACSEKQSHEDCSFDSPMGDTISGTCDTPPNSLLACIPQ